MNILVAEDNRKEREAICEHLTQHGHELYIALDGRGAINYLSTVVEIDAVITDAQMPKASGVIVLQYILATRRLPALIHSSSACDTIAGEPMPLEEIVKAFPFAEYHPKPKPGNCDYSYLDSFLAEIMANTP